MEYHIYDQFLHCKDQTCSSKVSFDIVFQIKISPIDSYVTCCYCTEDDAVWRHSHRCHGHNKQPPPLCLYDKNRFWLFHLNAHVRATMPAQRVSFISHAFLMFSATTVAMASQPASCVKHHSNKGVWSTYCMVDSCTCIFSPLDVLQPLKMVICCCETFASY